MKGDEAEETLTLACGVEGLEHDWAVDLGQVEEQPEGVELCVHLYMEGGGCMH